MYSELYSIWRREIEEASLGKLPPDFYTRLAEYLKRIGEQNLVDKKSVKVNLLDHEAYNVNQMLEQLLEARCKKLVKTITQNQKVPSESLTVEETKMSENFVAFAGAYQKFSKELLQGQLQVQIAPAEVQTAPITVKVITELSHKRAVLRFIKAIPSIIGADMKTYGPFMAEDVASVPVENAKMLVKQGLAVLVEVS
jgi:DNA replication factor GINS